jgi:hypothetical protein
MVKVLLPAFCFDILILVLSELFKLIFNGLRKSDSIFTACNPKTGQGVRLSMAFLAQK